MESVARKTYVLGITAFYHDSSAAIICDGNIVAAAQEERFTRVKNDSAFPLNAIAYVIKESGININELCAISYYEKPFLKFERILEDFHREAPSGVKSFCYAMPLWFKEKLHIKKNIRENLKTLGLEKKTPLFFPEHHLSHAASAFYPSPFNESAILVVDGVGEFATTTIFEGKDNKIKVLKELHYPHSLGFLYSAFTHFCGFKVNSGEGKLMGLAPYGNKDSDQKIKFKKLIYDEILDVRVDGSFLLNQKYFNFNISSSIIDEKLWEDLFDTPKRKPEGPFLDSHLNLALAIQEVLQEVLILLAKTAKELTGSNNLVMAGGVALNCVANGEIQRENLFENIWIQPAPGDAGCAIGACLATWHIALNKERVLPLGYDNMKGSLLGPSFSNEEILSFLNNQNIKFQYFENFTDLTKQVADFLTTGSIVGWFQGRMEFGPRSLGSRSILADARMESNQQRINKTIKFREDFRPFAPSILEEDSESFFQDSKASPYMLFTYSLKESDRILPAKDEASLPIHEKIRIKRSSIAAVTHVDYSARIQTVGRDENPRYWQLLSAVKERTGYGVVVNTSFNVRGEPIVCTPEEAYNCFARTSMDYIVLGNYLIKKVVDQ